MEPSSEFACEFKIGDRVIIDGDTDIVARVIGVLFREIGAQAEVSWLHNGSVQTAWIALFRLEPFSQDGV